MKRMMIAFVLALALVLAACGGGEGTAPAQGSSDAAGVTSAEQTEDVFSSSAAGESTVPDSDTTQPEDGSSSAAADTSSEAGDSGGDASEDTSGEEDFSADPETCGHKTTKRSGAVKATCLHKGSTGELVCAECGKVLEPASETPIGDHKPVYEGYIPPTCTEPGNTGSTVCGECGKLLVQGTPIAARGHFTNIVNYRAPKDGNPGYTGDEVCIYCKLTVKYGTTIPCDITYTETCSMVNYVASIMPHERSNVLARSYFDWYSGGCNGEGPYIDDYLINTHAVLYAYGNYYGEARDAEQQKRYKELNDWATGVIRQLGITNKTTVRDAVGKLNIFLCEYLEYDFSLKNHYPYEALRDKITVCSGYSWMFQFLCQRCGIESYYIPEQDINHAYNSVVFSDGTTLYVDVTWNDSSLTDENGNRVTDPDRLKPLREIYLLLDYDTMYKEHRYASHG